MAPTRPARREWRADVLFEAHRHVCKPSDHLTHDPLYQFEDDEETINDVLWAFLRARRGLANCLVSAQSPLDAGHQFHWCLPPLPSASSRSLTVDTKQEPLNLDLPGCHAEDVRRDSKISVSSQQFGHVAKEERMKLSQQQTPPVTPQTLQLTDAGIKRSRGCSVDLQLRSIPESRRTKRMRITDRSSPTDACGMHTQPAKDSGLISTSPQASTSRYSDTVMSDRAVHSCSPGNRRINTPIALTLLKTLGERKASEFPSQPILDQVLPHALEMDKPEDRDKSQIKHKCHVCNNKRASKTVSRASDTSICRQCHKKLHPQAAASDIGTERSTESPTTVQQCPNDAFGTVLGHTTPHKPASGLLSATSDYENQASAKVYYEDGISKDEEDVESLVNPLAPDLLPDLSSAKGALAKGASTRKLEENKSISDSTPATRRGGSMQTKRSHKSDRAKVSNSKIAVHFKPSKPLRSSHEAQCKPGKLLQRSTWASDDTNACDLDEMSGLVAAKDGEKAADPATVTEDPEHSTEALHSSPPAPNSISGSHGGHKANSISQNEDVELLASVIVPASFNGFITPDRPEIGVERKKRASFSLSELAGPSCTSSPSVDGLPRKGILKKPPTRLRRRQMRKLPGLFTAPPSSSPVTCTASLRTSSSDPFARGAQTVDEMGADEYDTSMHTASQVLGNLH